MKRSNCSDEIQLVSVGKRRKMNGKSDSDSFVIDLTGSGNTFSVLKVDPIDINEFTLFQDHDVEREGGVSMF